MTIQHLDGCSQERIEETVHAAESITTTRCLDCGGHEARNASGDILPPPDEVGPLAGTRGGADFTSDMKPMVAGAAAHATGEWTKLTKGQR